MAFPSDLVPPGAHIAADLTWDDERGSHHTQLRILGDDNRGYLLMGGFELADDGEFWFGTLAEAKEAALELGVPIDAWGDVTDASQVQPGRD